MSSLALSSHVLSSHLDSYCASYSRCSPVSNRAFDLNKAARCHGKSSAAFRSLLLPTCFELASKSTAGCYGCRRAQRMRICASAGDDSGSGLGSTKEISTKATVEQGKRLPALQEGLLEQVDNLLSTIKWDKNGLVVAIAQHLNTGAILMQGFANPDAISATLTSGKATFYSRSRSSLWTKGEISSNFINVKDVFLDCDRDSIIYLGLPDGPTCHTGAETCYFTPALSTNNSAQDAAVRPALTTFLSLEETINKRKAQLIDSSTSMSKPSWTHKLLKDHRLLCSKIREEVDELCRTLESKEGKDRTASEMADVLYHAMVLLAVQDVKVEDVLEVLRKRFSQSGIEEKSSRK